MLKRIALLFSLLIGLSGCAGTATLVDSLAKDEASVCVSVTTLYGKVQIARTKITNGNVQCTPDGGLTVKSDGVPLNATIKNVVTP